MDKSRPNGMDSVFRKLVRPMDARGLRGIFSRGRNVYSGGTSAPNTKHLQDFRQAAIERYRNANRTRAN